MIVRASCRAGRRWFLMLCIVWQTLAGPNLCFPAEPPSDFPAARPLEYMVLVTGGELLQGMYADAHTPYLTRALRPLGCRCAASMIVDDNQEEMQRALRFATNQVSLIIVTGGLGPTANDITRETLSAFMGIPLRESSELLSEMEKRFQQTREQLRPNLRRQTQVPTRGGYFKNASGTAAGLIFDSGANVIVALPGPPGELRMMVENELVPYLRQRFGVRPSGCSLTVRFVGAGQSLIDQTLKEHATIDADVVVTSLFEGGRVDFTFAVPGSTPADCARLKQLEAVLHKHLDQYLYADDGSSLEEVILDQIQRRGGSLAIVEIGTGGSLMSSLSSVKRNRSTLAGGYAAPNETAMARVLGIQVLEGTGVERAKALADAGARVLQCDWAIGVGPVETEDRAGTGVWVACRVPGNSWGTGRLQLRESGEISRATLTTQILDLLRRKIRQLP